MRLTCAYAGTFGATKKKKTKYLQIKRAMKKRKKMLLFLILLNQILIFGQETYKFKLVKEENIKEDTIGNLNQYRNLFDHKGNFISKYDFSYSEQRNQIEFVIGKTFFKLERFLFAIVNTKANRLYTFGESPLPSDCGGRQCPIRGFKIYDLKGNLIISNSTTFNSSSKFGCNISDKGNLFITGQAIDSDTLLVKKFNLNGEVVWEQDFKLKNKFEPRLRLKLSSDGTLIVSESPINSFSPITNYYLIDRESGDLIFQKELGHRSRMVLFNKTDLVYENLIYIFHQSIEKEITKNLKLMFTRYLTSDETGKYFGGILRTNSESNIPLVIYKKEGVEYIKFKELNLASFDFNFDTNKRLLIPHGNLEIKSDGSVEFVSTDKKFIFN